MLTGLVGEFSVSGQFGRFAVDGGGGGEDQPCDAGGVHGVQEGEGGAGVVVPVLSGVLHRLPGGDQAREVQYRIESGLRGEDLGDVVDAAADEFGVGGDLPVVVAGQVVDDGDLMVVVEEYAGDGGADVAGATGDQNLHLTWRGDDRGWLCGVLGSIAMGPTAGSFRSSR